MLLFHKCLGLDIQNFTNSSPVAAEPQDGSWQTLVKSNTYEEPSYMLYKMQMRIKSTSEY